MNDSPFHAMMITSELAALRQGAERLLPVYASANIDVYPYQIAAASFALRSPYLNGVILSDEGGLGKTYEAMLVVSELYFEGRDRILLIVPTPMLKQWESIISEQFPMPVKVLEQSQCKNEQGNPFDCELPVLTSYECAVQQAEHIGQVCWNVALFDEAHRLSKCYTGEHKTSFILKEATQGAFKLLLTATPMQNFIMDLYGLIHFIDEDCLGDAEAFYKRYFRKPENYSELAGIASRYCFRTLRSQVVSYVKLPRRIPVTANYAYSADETRLSALVDAYLNKPDKLAFPQMDSYDLTLLFGRALSSSVFALCKLADNAAGRVRELELAEIAELSASIKPHETGKGQALLKALKTAFAGLKKCGANRKVLIFTESIATLGFLHVLLSDTYKTLTFNGSNSTDDSIIRRFESEAEILIATDIAAEGFHLAFCSCVINFDLPYSVLTLEQRIMRCHRQGQQNDVVVLNFLQKDNFADVRMLELINKRLLQFDGIMGRSDDILGQFTDHVERGIAQAFATARHQKVIEAAFQASLQSHEEGNVQSVAHAENVLFTTFTAEVAGQVTVTPQYVKDKTAEINAKLWRLTRWFFADKRGYTLDEQTKTLHVGFDAAKVFTGTTLRRRTYSIADRTLSLASPIAKNMIAEVYWKGVSPHGTIVVDEPLEPCTIGFYRILVAPKQSRWLGTSYYAFAGQTVSGQPLTDEECRKLMALPVVRFTADGARQGSKDNIVHQTPHALDERIQPKSFVRRALSETDASRGEEIALMQEKARRAKGELGRKMESLKNDLHQLDNALSRASNVTERINAEKRKATVIRELKRREQAFFMEGLQIDAEAEAAVQTLVDGAGMNAVSTRLFIVEVTNESYD